MGAPSSPRLVDLTVRLPEDVSDLIDRAARVSDVSPAEFMITAATLAAQEALADQANIVIKPEAFEAIVKVLEDPPFGEAYHRLMTAPRPWKT